MFALSAAPLSAAVFSYEFNTPGNTEGWSTSTATTGLAVVSGFGQATGIDGTSGVLTSADVDMDPQIFRTGAGNVITLPAGEKWSIFTVRFRQLSANPSAAGVTSSAYSNNGTILFFNNSTNNLGTGGLNTKSVNGSGGFAGDVYTMTLTNDPAGANWQLLEVNFSAATVLNGANITAVRFDPVGNDAAKNFEVDFIRLISVPEPGSVLLSLLGTAVAFARRRR